MSSNVFITATTTSSTTTTSYNLGPLTTTYSPSGASCTTVWQRLENGGLEYGPIDTAPETSSCFPTSYNPYGGFYYSPGVCPSGYTIGCTAAVAGDGLSATAATCCPSWIADYDSYSSISVTTVVAPGNVVFAEGVVVRRDSNDPAWSQSSALNTTATISATSSSTGTGSSAVGSGIPSGAYAGIGIGCAILIVGVACLAWFCVRRRRAIARPSIMKSGAMGPSGELPGGYKGEYERHEAPVVERPQEVPGESRYGRLAALQQTPAELPAEHPYREY